MQAKYTKNRKTQNNTSFFFIYWYDFIPSYEILTNIPPNIDWFPTFSLLLPPGIPKIIPPKLETIPSIFLEGNYDYMQYVLLRTTNDNNNYNITIAKNLRLLQKW